MSKNSSSADMDQRDLEDIKICSLMEYSFKEKWRDETSTRAEEEIAFCQKTIEVEDQME